MSNSLPLNPFMSVRPRGKDMPSAKPRGRARSKAPMQGSIPPATKSMDSTGRFTVSVVSPPHFGVVGALRTADAHTTGAQ